jgi:hypothetical protein
LTGYVCIHVKYAATLQFFLCFFLSALFVHLFYIHGPLSFFLYCTLLIRFSHSNLIFQSLLQPLLNSTIPNHCVCSNIGFQQYCVSLPFSSPSYISLENNLFQGKLLLSSKPPALQYRATSCLPNFNRTKTFGFSTSASKIRT